MNEMMINKLPRRGFSLGLTALALIWLATAITVNAAENSGAARPGQPVRDLTWFLQRMRTVDHLPELDDSTTFGSGTWNPTDGNGDDQWYRGVVDDYTNVLFEVDGPGCLTRLCLERPTKPESRLQIFLDGASTPTLDLPARAFFTPGKSVLPSPLVFTDAWSGMFMPVPFAKHLKVQIYDPSGTPKPHREFNGVKYFGGKGADGGPAAEGWGRFYEWDYIVYAKDVPVKSFQYPLRPEEQAEVLKTAEEWQKATTQTTPLTAGRLTMIEKVLELAPGPAVSISVDKPGTIRRIAIYSEQAEALLRVKMRATWDGAGAPSVDAPVGYFFGCGDRGFKGHPYHSLLIGGDPAGVYANFPMPFRKSARFDFVNHSDKPVTITVKMWVDHATPIPAGHGFFHATWTEDIFDREIDTKPNPRVIMAGCGLPKLKPWPAYVYLKREGLRGKYVGLLLHAGWPYGTWWGEGDALIWTDRTEWPPNSHGTGAECYFNGGWGSYADFAVSGVASKVKMPPWSMQTLMKLRDEPLGQPIWEDRPGDVMVYRFHTVDGFQFRNSITMALEVFFDKNNRGKPNLPANLVVHGGTAFWYSDAPQPALSDDRVLWPRWVGPAWKSLRKE